jgi:hypothetical protein
VGFFDRFRGSWSLAGVTRPWPEGESIHARLVRHTSADGKLSDAGLSLGDEARQAPSRARWAAGALDGVLGHHLHQSTDGERVAELAAALVVLLRRADASSLSELYRLVTREPLLGIVDRLTDHLRDATDVQASRVHALGTVLAREAPHREAVKLGLALIGSIDADDTELILALGAHEEFTLFAAVALVNQNRAQSERSLLRLAQRVDGWGRIQVVERLIDSRDPEVRGWLLREGFRNSVMDEYLAYTCAMGGELHVALGGAAADEALLRGASGILRALANGGPAQDLADYPHAEVAVTSFLEHLEREGLDLERLSALDALAQRPELTSALQERISRQLEQAHTRSLIESGLAVGGDREFELASSAARARGMSTFLQDEARVRAGQLDLALFQLLRGADTTTIDRALAAVAPHVGSDSGVSGAAVGGWLTAIVHELHRFPGRGAAFVEAALNSPLALDRAAALRTLAAWGKPTWPGALAAALDRAILGESRAQVKLQMERVRDGGGVEELEEDEAEDDDESSSSSPVLH